MPTLKLATIAVLGMALLVAGCGRKGPLDPPPGGAALTPEQTQDLSPSNTPGGPLSTVNPVTGVNSAVDPDNNQQRPVVRGQRRSLPIDVLID